MTKQKQKDILWRLDEDVDRLTSELSRLTGQAWKASVEEGYGDPYRIISHALTQCHMLHHRVMVVRNALEEEVTP